MQWPSVCDQVQWRQGTRTRNKSIGTASILLGLIFRPELSWLLVAIGVFILGSFTLAYQYGAYTTKWRYMPVMLLLQIPIAPYEQSGLVYAIFSKPNTSTFETIRKV
jgi:hypothetical protein